VEIALTLSLSALLGLVVAALVPVPARDPAVARVRHSRRMGRQP